MILTPDEMVKDVLRMLWGAVDEVATPETRDEVAGKVLEAFSGYMFKSPVGEKK